jgi:hypothetical protein
MAQQAPRGEAQDYYQEQQPQSYEQPKYGQQPPQYGNNGYAPQNYAPQNYEAQGEKQDFNQAFKLDKPKWNDWWAGLLVSLRCVMSGELRWKLTRDLRCNLFGIETLYASIDKSYIYESTTGTQYIYIAHLGQI